MNVPLPVSRPFLVRDLPRLGSILRIAVENGWGHYMDRLRLKGYLPGGAETAEAKLGDTRRLRAALAEFPELLARGLRQLQKGEATLRVRHEHLENLEEHLDRANNRIGFSLIIAAIVVASSIVMSLHTGPHFQGIPLLGLLGYLLASFLGLWAVAILRSRKL